MVGDMLNEAVVTGFLLEMKLLVTAPPVLRVQTGVVTARPEFSHPPS